MAWQTNNPVASPWDREVTLGTVDRTPIQRYVINRVWKNGETRVTIREWYRTANDPTWKPSKNGITIYDSMLSQVLKVLEENDSGN